MFRLVATLLALQLCSGCASELRNIELQRVAKDWSLVIRASQIIPVYPLTEDLQPGDIFLVQRPIDKQHELYDERGFLPLENLIHRVNPRGYQAFYENSLGLGGDTQPIPKRWLTNQQPWAQAPIASFPTYSFSVRSGSGFSLALPVQGVPIGLSLLGSDAAQGTITIADARTYGVDTVSLASDVEDWAAQQRGFLRNYASSGTNRNYLRVVSRVYLAGRLNVSLQASESSGATGSGGAPKPVELMTTAGGTGPQEASLEAYKSNLAKLNELIEKSLEKAPTAPGQALLPGGTVKVVAASARAISLAETFSRPLVVGYLGFDMAIGPGGILGPPIPTYAVLTAQLEPPPATVALELLDTAGLRHTYEVLTKLGKRGDPRAVDLVKQLDGLGTLVPRQYPCNIFHFADAAGPLSIQHPAGAALPDQKGFLRVTLFLGKLQSSIEDLELAQVDKNRKVATFDMRDATVEAYLASELSANRTALRDMYRNLRAHGDLLAQAQEHSTQATRRLLLE